MKQSTALFIYLFLCFHFNLFAQSTPTPSSIANISGRIYSSDEAPIGFANVLLLNAVDSSLVKGDFTADNGDFKLEIKVTGDYLIKAEMIGYESKFSLPINMSTLQDIQLPKIVLKSGVTLDAVTVTADKPLIELNAEKMIINVANSSVNAGNSALEILSKAPGVSVNHQNEISLRGKEGVLVMINGKNHYLSQDDLARMLENMPASGIEKIEIITNPSAKYDAEGNAGIINIVLSKNENHGTNGRISSTLRQGIKTSHFHNANANFRKDKINVFGAGEYYNWGWYQETKLSRNIPSPMGNTSFIANGIDDNGGNGFNIRLGADYNLSPKTTVGVLAKWNAGDEQRNDSNLTEIAGANMPDFHQLTVSTLGAENYNNATYNLNVVHNFEEDKSSLTFDADYNTHRLDNLLNYENDYFDENGIINAPTYMLRNTLFTTVDIFATKADYSLKINDKYNFEAGAKFSQVGTTNGTTFEYRESEGWINQANRSNSFEYQETVSAIYLNGNAKFGKVGLQAGLRAENTHSRGNSLTLNQEVIRSYTDLFPSVSVSHPIGENQNFSYSYSRRLNRPNYNSLNPFIFYLDQFTYSSGNPFLNPQYANSLGINYSLNNKLYISVDASKTKDLIDEVLEQDSETNTTLSTTRNLDTQKNLSLSVSVPKVLSDWWTAKFTYVGYYFDFKADLESGYLDRDGLGHLLQINNEFKMADGWAVELSGSIQSRLTYSFFEIAPKGNLDFGVSKSFFKDQLQVKLAASDLFRTSVNQITSQFGEIDLELARKNDSRRVSLTLGWSFGNKKMKGARNRNTASEDEAGRL